MDRSNTFRPATAGFIWVAGVHHFEIYFIMVNDIFLLISICQYADARGYRKGCTPLSETALCVEVSSLAQGSPVARQYVDEVLASGRQLYAFDAKAMIDLIADQHRPGAATPEDNRRACAELHVGGVVK